MTLTQLSKRIPNGYKLEWLEAKEGFTVGLFKGEERVVKIGAYSQDSALGSMKDWLILNQLYLTE